MDALDAIFTRRSYGKLREPAPTGEDLTTILRAGAAAPDHKTQRPWKFVVLTGEGKDDFGLVLAEAYRARCEARGKEIEPAKEDKERTKLGRAPLVIVLAMIDRGENVVSRGDLRGSAAAAAQNMLLAAAALGYGSIWRTGDPTEDPKVKAALGLSEADEITGFLYLGTVIDGMEKPANDPSLDGLVEYR